MSTTATTVHGVLPDYTSGDWSTVAQVATALNLGYSTASRHLRDLVAAGRAEATRATTAQGKGNVYRQAANSKGRPGARKAQGVKPADAPAAPAGQVWVATAREGVEYHKPADGDLRKTRCGRDTGGRYGRFIDSAEAAQHIYRDRPCPRCYRDSERIEAAAKARDAVAQPVQTPEAGDSGDLHRPAGPRRDLPWSDTVWAPTVRKGISFHEPTEAGRTLCGRSMASATSWVGTRDEAMQAGMRPCDRCVTATLDAIRPVPAQRPVPAPEVPAPGDVQGSARSAASVDAGPPAGSVEAWLTSQRPTPEAPPERPRTRRTREPRPARRDEAKASFRKGELRDAVLDTLRAADRPLTPGEIAKRLNAYTGPVGTNLVRMLAAGTVVKVSADGERLAFRAAG